jgi:hypothetical protein
LGRLVFYFFPVSWNQSRQLLTNWWQAQKRVKTVLYIISGEEGQ